MCGLFGLCSAAGGVIRGKTPAAPAPLKVIADQSEGSTMRRLGGIVIGLMIVVAGLTACGGWDRDDTRSPTKAPATPAPPPPAPQTPPKAVMPASGGMPVLR